MAPTSSSAVEWAPLVGMSKLWQYSNQLRSLTWVQLTHDNMVGWRLGLLGRKEMEDIEGPLYIFGAPSRQIEDGKAVLAPPAMLKNSKDVYLLVLELKDAKGAPLPFGEVDLWQTDIKGDYYVSNYTLRGRATADGDGRVEVLTVRPGEYKGRNVGHIHIVLSGVVGGKNRSLTTQAYLCHGNNPAMMDNDILTRWVRARPDGQVVHSATVGAANKGYFGLDELPGEDVEMARSVAQWNARLKDRGIGSEVAAVGRHVLKLT